MLLSLSFCRYVQRILEFLAISFVAVAAWFVHRQACGILQDIWDGVCIK
jgi:hypothetical protein